MTETDYNDLLREQLRRRKRWMDRCSREIVARLADAEAHARKAVTETLRAAPDGRPTARVATRNPSFQAANARLDDLLSSLAGPRRDSLEGLLRDARADFYREAFEDWRPHLDEDTHRTDAGPTQEGERIARGAIVHGYELHHELEGIFEQSKRSLFAVVNAAGRRGSPTGRRDAARDLFATWRTQAATSLARRCESVLADSQSAIFWSVWTALEKSPPS